MEVTTALSCPRAGQFQQSTASSAGVQETVWSTQYTVSVDSIKLVVTGMHSIVLDRWSHQEKDQAMWGQ